MRMRFAIKLYNCFSTNQLQLWMETFTACWMRTFQNNYICTFINTQWVLLPEKALTLSIFNQKLLISMTDCPNSLHLMLSMLTNIAYTSITIKHGPFTEYIFFNGSGIIIKVNCMELLIANTGLVEERYESNMSSSVPCVSFMSDSKGLCNYRDSWYVSNIWLSL